MAGQGGAGVAQPARSKERTGGRRGWRERRRELVPWVVFLIVFGLMPVVYRAPFQHNVVVLICVTALMATGWNLLGGFTGQISLGHALFFGIGAYTTAMAGIKYGLNPWLGLLIGALLAVAISAGNWC